MRDTSKLEENTWTTVIDNWLAAGFEPRRGDPLYPVESARAHTRGTASVAVDDHTLGWLERVPSYKDQQAQLADHDLST